MRARGDAAVVDYTRKFDKVETDARACASPTPSARRRRRRCRLRSARRWPSPPSASRPSIARCCRAMSTSPTRPARGSARATGRSMRSASMCRAAPAAYPSSVLMNIVPAKVAGVKRIVMVVPTPDGVLNPLVMLAAEIAGADEVWRIGGAQAVAALAYGTQSIKPVDKITGPGNAYVAAAKRRVFGQVGIDLIAGPSEILVVADRRQRSGLDRRRPAVAGRARCLLAVGADRRRCGLCRSRLRRRSTSSSRRMPRADDRRGELARQWLHHPGARPRGVRADRRPHRRRACRARDGGGTRRGAEREDRAMPARSSSAATRPRRSATMSPAPTTCCRPRARRASRAASASPIS